ncbi:MAG: hypothetical protein O2782_19125 [bacterium]|nr:hypothetical protein [bacterium]
MTATVATQAQVPQAAVDSASVRVPASGFGAQVSGVADSGEADSVTGLSPRGALLRSALIPGWGQLSQGHPWKAVLFSGAGIGWLSAALADAASVGNAATATVRQDRAARRNTRVLFYVITATLAGLDAYVDAHLDDFHLEADPFMAGAQLTRRF